MAEGEVRKGKDRPYPLPFVIALVMWVWLTYLFWVPEMVDRTQFTFSQWVTIGYLVTVIMLAWLVIWKVTIDTEVAVPVPVEEPPKKPKAKAKPAASGGTVAKKPAPPAPKKKRVVVASGDEAVPTDTADMPPDGLRRPEEPVEEEIEDMPRVVEYPQKEPGGVYSDTLVRVDENLILNLRLLLGKVCHNCEELDDCKRRVEGKLDEDVFLSNFECKDGIKRELQRARKKREAEEQKASDAKDMVKQKADEAKAEDEEEAEGDEKGAEGDKAPAKKRTVKKTSKKGSATKGGKKAEKDQE